VTGEDRGNERLLQVADLQVSFRTLQGDLTAVRGTTWHVDRGETVVILGESGSGKSVSVHAIAGLLPSNATVRGSARLSGTELVGLGPAAMRRVRANDIGMVFQDPLRSLDPCYTIGDQIGEIFRVHRGLRRTESLERAVDLLELVRIPEPLRRAKQYPHELSGGMRQRVMIAMAISLEPKLLLADEPTTALDTSVRGSILQSIQEMRDRLGIGVLLITHDVGVAAAVADRIAVMYAGRVVEYGPTRDVLHDPAHPYTAALLASMPRLGQAPGTLQAISGTPPSLTEIPTGCSFAPRCRFATDECTSTVPALTEVDASSRVAACLHSEELRTDDAFAV
jgi:peptide/nickel transport system ATP-binding protein